MPDKPLAPTLIVPVTYRDGTVNPVRLFAAKPSTAGAVRGTVAFFPGLGMPAGYFDKFAAGLARVGFNVALSELRGQGDSRPRSSANSRHGFHDVASEDFPEVFEVARTQFGEQKRVVVGHSIGGQVASLYTGRAGKKVSALILLASGTPYFRGYGVMAVPTFAATTVVNSVAAVRGFWPGSRLDGYGPQSRRFMADWGHLSRTGHFAPQDADIDYEKRMASVTTPILAVTYDGDSDTPQGSCDHLLSKFPAAPRSRRFVRTPAAWLEKTGKPLGHNAWAREVDTTMSIVDPWLMGIGV